MSELKELAVTYTHNKVIPCVVLAILVHPLTLHNFLNRISWGFYVYLESVSVLPQLRVMQNTKIVEPFTAHYVFALGVARFLSCAHWVLQIVVVLLIGSQFGTSGHGEFSKPVGNASRSVSTLTKDCRKDQSLSQW